MARLSFKLGFAVAGALFLRGEDTSCNFTRAVVVTVVTATAVVGVAFEIVVGTGTKVAVAATDQSKMVYAAFDGIVAVP